MKPRRTRVDHPAQLLVAAAGQPPAVVVEELLCWLCDELSARSVSWVPSGPTELEAARAEATGELGGSASSSGLRLSAAVVLDGLARGTVQVEPAAGDATAVRRALALERTAECVAVLVRSARLRAESARWSGERDAAVAELDRGVGRLAAVQTEERRRLAVTLLGVTGRPARRLTTALEELAELEDAAGGGEVDGQLPERVAAATGSARSAATDLVDAFRRLARGVHPLALRQEGAAVALSDVGERLGVPVSVLHDRDRRSGWEVENGLFWVVVAVLDAVAGWPTAAPVIVRWGIGGGRLTCDVQVDITRELSDDDREELSAALEAHSRRLEALGGGWSVAVGERSALTTCWLPEDLGRRPGPRSDVVPPWSEGVSRGSTR